MFPIGSVVQTGGRIYRLVARAGAPRIVFSWGHAGEPVEYPAWAGRYVAVTNDLGYSRDEDARAALVLARTIAKLGRKPAGDEPLSHLLSGKVVYVCGAGPTLEAELGDAPLEGTVIAADSAAARLMAR